MVGDEPLTREAQGTRTSRAFHRRGTALCCGRVNGGRIVRKLGSRTRSGRFRRILVFASVCAVSAIPRVALAGARVVAQENPYAPPSPDSGSIFGPLQAMPVWAQAALATMAVTLVFFGLIEVGRAGWDRWQRTRQERVGS
jgi:hypothetical protein